jgi:transcriptional regulator with XRE-family HTH domain
MRTVGEIFKQARLKKGLSLEEIEKRTKIRVKYLLAIEENDFAKIPQATTSRGFIRNYAQALGLSSEAVLAVFRRDFTENEKGQIIPRGMITPLDKFKFWWNPKLTVFLGVLIISVIFLGFLLRQYLNYISSPKITVVFPPEGEIFSTNQVEFLGKTDKDASFYINGEIVNLSPEGEFRKNVVLKEGENEIVLEAIGRREQKTRVIRKVKFVH